MPALRIARMQLACAVLVATASSSFAAIVAYDGFGGGARPDLNGEAGGQGWTGGWLSNDMGLVTGISGPGLTLPGLATTAGGAVTEPFNASGASEYARSFPSVSGDFLYVSFLYRPTANYGSYGGIQFFIYPANVFVGSVPGYYLYGFRYGHYGMSLSNVPENPDVTVFLVLEIESLPASGQSAFRLYVDPAPGAAKPSYSAVDFLHAGPALPSSVLLINDGGVTTDELRIGTTWGSVTPTPVCAGDLNGDRMVDLVDLATLLSHFGTPSGGAFANGDMDGDGDVDLSDLAGLLARFGTVCP